MRITRTIWIFLGVVVLIAAGITLYMLFRGQVNEQERLNSDLSVVNMELVRLSGEKLALEAEIAQLEDDIDQQGEDTSQMEAEIIQLQDELAQLEEERAQAEAQALVLLSQAKAKFSSSAESIEYDEILMGFVKDANLRLETISVSDVSEQTIDGIEYNATAFNLTVRGDVEDILNFISTVVNNEAFKTSVLNAFGIAIPETLTDDEITALEETVRAGLNEEAIAKITTEDILGFILEALTDVIGDRVIAGVSVANIEIPPIEEIAQTIRDAINGLVEPEYVNFIAIDLSQIILEHIEGSIVGKIIGPLSEEIAAAIAGDSIRDIEELVGDDIAALLGNEIVGMLPGEIESLLNGYISDLIEEKMLASVAEEVESAVAPIVAEMIEGMEMSSSSITIVIYTFEGE